MSSALPQGRHAFGETQPVHPHREQPSCFLPSKAGVQRLPVLQSIHSQKTNKKSKLMFATSGSHNWSFKTWRNVYQALLQLLGCDSFCKNAVADNFHHRCVIERRALTIPAIRDNIDLCSLPI